MTINNVLPYFNCCFSFSVQFRHTSAAMPSELETAMESLIKVFHRYATNVGKDRAALTRRQLKDLMENELSTFLLVRRDCMLIV